MNTYIKKIILSSLTLVFLMMASCQDYLSVDTPSNLSQGAVFNSISYTEAAIVGIYNRLSGDHGYGQRISTIYTVTTDDFKPSGSSSIRNDRRGIGHFTAVESNNDLYEPFKRLCEGIERANIAIKYIPISDLFNNGTEEEKATMRRLYGEALTLRALFYQELVRNWGDVPAHFEPAADLENLYLEKEDRDIILDRIIDDLDEAAQFVPWRTASPNPNTRISKAAVKGLRARIALARGGYSLRRESLRNERRDDYRKYYEIALNECWDIIESQQHFLTSDFENLFKSLHGNSNLDDQNEIIFKVGAYGSGSHTDSKLGLFNGIRVDNASGYGNGGGGNILAVPTYFYEFDSIGDSRRDVTIAYYHVTQGNLEIQRADRWTDGKFRRTWTSNFGDTQYLGVQWPVIRFADILLMYAEAENELNSGPGANAIGALQLVRSRAFAGYEHRMPEAPSGYEDFFKAIVQERFLEFGGEGIRKYDLIRWNLYGTKLNETREKLVKFVSGEGRYALLPEKVYFGAVPFDRSASVKDLTSSFRFADGATIASILFTPSNSTAPADGTIDKSVDWREDITADYIDGGDSGYAKYFVENKKELFPLEIRVLNSNYNITNDTGYLD